MTGGGRDVWPEVLFGVHPPTRQYLTYLFCFFAFLFLSISIWLVRICNWNLVFWCPSTKPKILPIFGYFVFVLVLYHHCVFAFSIWYFSVPPCTHHNLLTFSVLLKAMKYVRSDEKNKSARKCLPKS